MTAALTYAHRRRISTRGRIWLAILIALAVGWFGFAALLGVIAKGVL